MNTTATLTPGTTTEYEGYTLTPMGEVKLGRSTYKVQRQDFTDTGRYEYQLKGSRGALYILNETTTPGKYRPHSLFGGPMVRKGNPVYVTFIGDMIEFTN